jgi:hypothetical protein
MNYSPCLHWTDIRSGIVATVLLFGTQAFAYGGFGDYGGYPPFGGYGDYGDYGGYSPYGVYCSYADYKSNVITYGDCFGY